MILLDFNIQNYECTLYRYDVVLSPAVKTGPKLTPASSPMTEDDINKKLKEAEDRKVSMDNIR